MLDPADFLAFQSLRGQHSNGPEAGYLVRPSRRFSVWEGRNTTTFRAPTGCSSPVCGLRPARSRLWRTENEPKLLNLTISPSARWSATASSVCSRRFAQSAWDSPTSCRSASTSARRVMVLGLSLVRFNDLMFTVDRHCSLKRQHFSFRLG